MSDTAVSRNGGRILVDALVRNAVDTVYCVPGESYLPVLDALHDAQGVRTIVTRHEGAASNMADAYGKLTGRPGICFVTRGPGATHASNGVHTAREDSTPMILFVGQVESGFVGRGGFQEVDYRQMFGGLAKWVTEIDSLERIPEIVAKAFSVALAGRPGPVVIALPENVLFGSGAVADAPAVRVTQAAPAADTMDELRALLAAAQRPLVVVGGTGWDAHASAAFKRFIVANNLPVAASFRRQDLFDNRDPHYVGQLGLGVSPKLAERAREADLLLVVGSRLAETTSSGYTIVQSPAPRQTLVHVHPDPQELGRTYQARLPINAGMREFAHALDKLEPVISPWRAWTEAARADYVVHSTPPQPSAEIKGVDLAQVVAHLNDVLPDDAVIANGAGNYTVWVHRFYRYRRPATELAPTNGAMGYGFPAAIAAKLQDPARTVVCFAGDGCFMMYPQELATAVQFGAPLVVIVVNNGMLGTIRMHQEREYPGRVSATDLVNPDFVAFAKAFGAHAERVERTEDFPAAFERAQRAGVAALIELRMDPRQITPVSRLNG
ncbi:thiamine pyrophosphate-binding protein [Paraburkholderia solisilvae]|uniref:Acetolactate synthase isozyme 2 large subunit n=1 Tax=Paraburkholderia solisilvae TaxID=624376 RepID=A0A6J5D4I7_9BURK|nr:thiamine pyrophosphate-binding protein [Paraburkholderia solisilvae]CAB3748224.1 Acetolactate synthase isozyme 2 large subunit [Paraburkholderia solisilvae]